MTHCSHGDQITISEVGSLLLYRSRGLNCGDLMWQYAVNMFYYHWLIKAAFAYDRAEYSQIERDVYRE